MKWKLKRQQYRFWDRNDKVKGGEPGRGWGNLVRREKKRGRKVMFIDGCVCV